MKIKNSPYLKMNFDALPLDRQYDHFFRSSYREIIQYCRISPAARELCRDPSLWKQKALLDFNIPLDYAPEARTSAQRYALLNKEYQRASHLLLVRLIKGGLLPQALELYSRLVPDYQDEEKIMAEILMAAVESGRIDILSTFARKIAPIYRDVVEGPYFKTIQMNRPDLNRILVQYHSF